MPCCEAMMAKKILALVTDAYGGHGGVAAYNRDVLEAMAAMPEVDRIVVLPRVVSEVVGTIPTKVEFDQRALGGGGHYLCALFRRATAERFDLIYCAHINLAPLARAVSRMTGVPWALCLYGIDAWNRSPRRWVAMSASKADLYVPLSQLTMDRFVEAYPEARDRPVALLYNAVHLEQFGAAPPRADLVERYGLAGKTVILTAGRMAASEKAKGFDRVIALLPRLREVVPDIHYLIIGDGDDRANLEAQVRAAGIEELVTFAGWVPEDEKADHYRLANAFVMPSVGEGFGFVFIEALACGIPAVGSDVDGGREALRFGMLGAVLDPFDCPALIKAIVAAVKQSREVPAGLDYFAFPKFKERLADSIRPLLARRAWPRE